MLLNNNNKPMSVFRWIWQSYLKTALIPLILVELSFIGIYFFANNWSQKETINYLTEESRKQLSDIVKQEADIIQQQISSVTHTTELYRQQAARAIARSNPVKPEDAERLAYSPEGAYYTTRDRKDGGVAIFYSGAVPIGAKEREKVGNALVLENVMKDIIAAEPLAGSLYLNTFDSLNIIYPYFDVITQYAPRMPIPEFNFYYEADALHNPERKVVWTDAYLDPAGHGWMASAIAPVYNKNFLEGVVGIDVTISTITNQILKLEIPWNGYGILIGKDGTILALPTKGENDWGLTEKTEHSYAEAIKKDTFKPDEFNLYKRENLYSFAEQLANTTEGIATIKLNNIPQMVAWSTVPATGWKLLVIAPEANIFAKVNQMKADLFKIGLIMVVGLIFFYAVFFSFLARKSRQMSLDIAKPLQDINGMVLRIGDGDYEQDTEKYMVTEFSETAENIIKMGHQLGETNKSLLEARKSAEAANEMKSQFIANMSHEIRTPLNAIMGYTTLLKDIVKGEQGLKYIFTIQKAGNTLVKIINDILDLSKIEAGKFDIRKEYVDIHTMLEEIRETFAYRVKEKMITFNLYVDPSLPHSLLLDEVRIRQILFNLIGNAFKFTESGFIEVNVKMDNLQETQNNLDISFSVRDSGIGIAADQQTAIFEAFKQQDGQSSRRYGGTGLGLNIVKRFVEIMGGSITVNSKLNDGSTFSFTIPNVAIGKGATGSSAEQKRNSLGVEIMMTGSGLPEKTTTTDAIYEDKLQPLDQENSAELLEKLEEIHKGLWQECARSNRINDVKQLAKQLKMLAASFSHQAMDAYADDLFKVAQSFNLKEIKDLVGKYPDLLVRLKRKI